MGCCIYDFTRGVCNKSCREFCVRSSFLIHDLGMGIVAYNEGIDELKKTALWNDTFSSFQKNTEILLQRNN